MRLCTSTIPPDSIKIKLLFFLVFCNSSVISPTGLSDSITTKSLTPTSEFEPVNIVTWSSCKFSSHPEVIHHNLYFEEVFPNP